MKNINNLATIIIFIAVSLLFLESIPAYGNGTDTSVQGASGRENGNKKCRNGVSECRNFLDVSRCGCQDEQKKDKQKNREVPGMEKSKEKKEDFCRLKDLYPMAYPFDI